MEEEVDHERDTHPMVGIGPLRLQRQGGVDVLPSWHAATEEATNDTVVQGRAGWLEAFDASMLEIEDQTVGVAKVQLVVSVQTKVCNGKARAVLAARRE